MKKSNTYRSERHRIVREKQASNCPSVHHPDLKTEQITKVLDSSYKLKILELFAGEGNLTKIYKNYGTVECYDRKLGTGDSFIVAHRLISERKVFDVIDLDNYGWSNRMFPHIVLLLNTKKKTNLFLTIPKPYVNILNGITAQHLVCYYGESNPSLDTIISYIKNYSLMHWFNLQTLDIVDLGRLWRVAFRCERVKATEYTNTKNR